ncbi:MAG: hypothetical protein AB1744_15070, partial [Candidatus Zixiibacteriota bacterium]
MPRIAEKRMLLGFYQGIGDLLSAIPLCNKLLEYRNKLTILASRQNLALVPLLRFHEPGPEYIEFSLFSLKQSGRVRRLLKAIRTASPDYIFISPHAQKAVSSWKIPLLIRYLACTGGFRGQLCG